MHIICTVLHCSDCREIVAQFEYDANREETELIGSLVDSGITDSGVVTLPEPKDETV